jgi:transcriptional regulator with XRE-family HTH domain
MDDLADSLRSWRERLAPGDAGLPTQARRRAPGLRREEVAQLAGVSVNYLVRLEQGRARNPSPQVVAALARALRLTADERDHLFRLAGQAPPASGRMRRHVTPGVQRMLDRLTDLPVLVMDAGWTVVSWNPLAAALIGDFSAREGHERNILWRQFMSDDSRFVRDAEEQAELEAEGVADLGAALGRYPEDPDLRALVADLRAASPRFEALWQLRPAEVRTAARKTIRHPEVGDITVDCDVLTVHGTDLRLIVYSAPPGSPDAERLKLLGVVGLQRF